MDDRENAFRDYMREYIADGQRLFLGRPIVTPLAEGALDASTLPAMPWRFCYWHLARAYDGVCWHCATDQGALFLRIVPAALRWWPGSAPSRCENCDRHTNDTESVPLPRYIADDDTAWLCKRCRHEED